MYSAYNIAYLIAKSIIYIKLKYNENIIKSLIPNTSTRNVAVFKKI